MEILNQYLVIVSNQMITVSLKHKHDDVAITCTPLTIQPLSGTVYYSKTPHFDRSQVTTIPHYNHSTLRPLTSYNHSTITTAQKLQPLHITTAHKLQPLHITTAHKLQPLHYYDHSEVTTTPLLRPLRSYNHSTIMTTISWYKMFSKSNLKVVCS